MELRILVDGKEFVLDDPDAPEITKADVCSILKLNAIIMLQRWLAARAQALNAVLCNADTPEVFRLQGQIREVTMLYNLEEILGQFIKEKEEDGRKDKRQPTARVSRPSTVVN